MCALITWLGRQKPRTAPETHSRIYSFSPIRWHDALLQLGHFMSASSSVPPSFCQGVSARHRCFGVFLRHTVRIRCLGIAGLVRVPEPDLPGLNALPGPWPQTPQKQEHAGDYQQHHCAPRNHCVHPRFRALSAPPNLLSVSSASKCSTCRSCGSRLTRQTRTQQKIPDACCLSADSLQFG